MVLANNFCTTWDWLIERMRGLCFNPTIRHFVWHFPSLWYFTNFSPNISDPALSRLPTILQPVRQTDGQITAARNNVPLSDIIKVLIDCGALYQTQSLRWWSESVTRCAGIDFTQVVSFLFILFETIQGISIFLYFFITDVTRLGFFFFKSDHSFLQFVAFT